MKVIIFSTFYRCGGAELQAILERDILKNKNIQTLYITFDSNLESGCSCEEGHINICGNYGRFKRRLLNIFFDPVLYFEVSRLLNKEKPDLVHFHNITYGFITLALAAKKYTTVQTMHDYSYLCDKDMKCTRNGYTVCEDCLYENCKAFCFNNGIKSRLALIYKWNVRNLNGRIRKKYINHIISPSIKLSEYLNRFGYNSFVVNNPLDLDNFNIQKRLAEKRVVLMYGSVIKGKGIYQVLEAFKLSDYKNISFEIIGAKGSDLDEARFYSLLKKSGAKYLGEYTYAQIKDKLAEVFAVIVPSLWMENYPNTVLEGMASDCVVCGSDRGGIPEMVVKKDLIFDILNTDDVKKCFTILDTMSENERVEICKIQNEKIHRYNSPAVYLKNLSSVIGMDII